MNDFPENKEELWNFLNKNFPGKWEEVNNFFVLSLLTYDNNGPFAHSIAFNIRNVKSTFKNGTYTTNSGWKNNLSFQEINMFYKQNYKFKDFK